MFVGAVFAVIGGVIAIVGVAQLVKERSFVHGAVTAEGAVVGSNPMSSHDDHGMSITNYHAVVRFRVDGKDHEITDPLGTDPPTYQEGDTVKVSYDPANPDHAEITSALRQWGLATFLLVFGGLFLVLGVVAMVAF